MKIFFKKEKNFEKEKESLWLDINIYWKLSVTFVFISIILSSFFGYYLFMQINKDPVFLVGDNTSQVETVKKERISKVSDYFLLRKQKSTQIINSPASVVDPSL